MAIVDLRNDLGRLTILLPSRFDTTFTWIDFSDNSCDDQYKYRYADSDYPLIQETGFIYELKEDSLFFFTISHLKITGCSNNKSEIEQDDLDLMVKRERVLNPQNKLTFQKLLTINNRKYAVIADHNRVGNLDHAYISARTIVDYQIISINYNCIMHDCMDFHETMMKSLKTIKISGGNKK